jgi:hypothetical protein
MVSLQLLDDEEFVDSAVVEISSDKELPIHPMDGPLKGVKSKGDPSAPVAHCVSMLKTRILLMMF